MSKSSKNILVTGGAGYIGSHIVEQLVKKLNEEGVEISFDTKIQSINPSTGEIKFSDESV